jgi:hypothetical protein
MLISDRLLLIRAVPKDIKTPAANSGCFVFWAGEQRMDLDFDPPKSAGFSSADIPFR